jgi:hypothetical protein
LIVELKENGFNLKIENNLKDYLSCRVIEDKKRILILQSLLINKLQAKFGNEVEKKRVYKTPGTPRFGLKLFGPVMMMIPLMGVCKADTRSGIGMLLYLKKYSRPDLCNVVT